MPASNFVIVGLNPAIEITYEVAGISPSVLTASRYTHIYAGKGTTVACVLAKMGMRVSLISAVPSRDRQGFAKFLKDADVRLEEIVTEGNMRVSVVLCESSGDRQLIVKTPGPIILDTTGFVRQLDVHADRCFRAADYVGIAGSVPPGISPSVIPTLIRRASERELTTIVDLAGDPLRQAVESGCSVLKVNREEFASSFGCENDSEIHATASELVADFGCRVLVTDGPRDAYGVDRTGEFVVNVAPQIHRSVPAGCGDATMAALIGSLARGLSFRESCAVAIGVGSLTASMWGPGNLPWLLTDLSEVVCNVVPLTRKL